jgi:glycosyltransferase involved in cell wall biosynthesis
VTDPRPPLTVIVPTFNRSGYVRACLTGLRQSGVPDLEVIVADDGSTDDTKDVVAATDPRAKYLWQPNTGTPATARNAAFAVSTGRYVGFLDCDDAWLPGAPAEAVRLLDAHPGVDVLFADANMGNPKDGYVSWIGVAGQDEFFRLPHREVEPGFRVLERGPFFRRLAYRNPVFIGACVMRREAFAAGGGFDPKLRGAADWDLWLRMAHTLTFGFMTRPLAVYTRHLDNMSSNQDHMIGEFAQALRNTLAKCDLTAEERRHVRARLEHQLFGHAYLAYDCGDFRTARRRFATLLKDTGPSAKGLAFWAACALPFGLAGRLRGLKHRVSGGGRA